jgi:hypothetical protein
LLLWSGHELPLILQEAIPATSEIEKRHAEREERIVRGRRTSDELLPEFEQDILRWHFYE